MIWLHAEVKARYKEDGASILPLRFVFHVTPESNLDSILTQGLLPQYRRSHPEWDWFSESPTLFDISRRRKILVFLVNCVGAPRMSWDYVSYDILKMSCATYQLPVGTVEVCHA